MNTTTPTAADRNRTTVTPSRAWRVRTGWFTAWLTLLVTGPHAAVSSQRSSTPPSALSSARHESPAPASTRSTGPVTPYPILFMTQVPLPNDFATVNATFANHQAQVHLATRGGDLWIRYPDGTLRNLTGEAGFGSDDFQGLTSIAVRDPDVHWDGQRAVFAMAIGSVERQYQLAQWRWQLYEVTGLEPGDPVRIDKVRNQPEDYNNVMPVYAADNGIVFVSDRPRDGQAHLYPLLDEYERTPANTGLWRLDPPTGDLRLLDHAPSGDFHPMIDSFGRILFTRWDHLERDQLADADAGPVSSCFGGANYGSLTYSDESATATWSHTDLTEHFPEPRSCRDDLLAGTHLVGHGFNHFFPWMLLQDGSELETVNHVGRQELHGYIPRTFDDDPNVVDYYGQVSRTNPNPAFNFFQIAESPQTPGAYYGILAPEFGTHASGQLIRLLAAPDVNPDDMVIDYLTHPSTASTSDTPPPEHTGLQRDPLILSDGTVVVSHTAATRADRNVGTSSVPRSLYDYRLTTMVLGAGGYLVPGELLTAGITKTVSWWSPDNYVTTSGTLWELNAVEVRPRTRLATAEPPLAPPEASVFSDVGVDVAAFRAYLAANELALVVSRNVTTRDDFDFQQPLNLQVPGGVASAPLPGTVYDVSHIQFFQADMLRGQTGCCATDPLPGRRVLARPLHDPASLMCAPNSPTGPLGSKDIEPDGSIAALVPAGRATTWQLTDPSGTGVVRERYWLNFKPGEIRVCASCHGVNRDDQLGQPPPTNAPEALRKLLLAWTACTPQSGLLRNDEVTSLDPLQPALRTLLPLDPIADLYQPGFVGGSNDPEPGVLDDAGRPLVLYGVAGGVTLRLVKTMDRRVRVLY